jgi:cytochrome c oxidase subunit 1
MAMLGGIHYWWPKMFGRRYNEFWAKIACVLVFIGFNVTFFTQFFLGAKGMPRRYHNYLPMYQPLNDVSTVGAYILLAGFLIVATYLIHSLIKGKPAGNNPWGALGFEWETTSPPPPENFETPPSVTHGPYDYDTVLVEESVAAP